MPGPAAATLVASADSPDASPDSLVASPDNRVASVPAGITWVLSAGPSGGVAGICSV